MTKQYIGNMILTSGTEGNEMITATITDLTPGTSIHFVSLAGPCLPAKIIKVNRQTATVDFLGSVRKVQLEWIHTSKCGNCPGPDNPYMN